MNARVGILCLILTAGTTLAADVRIVEQIIAKVNGDIVTRGDLERSRRELEASLRQQGLSGAQLEQAMAERVPHLLRDRIDHLLMVQKAKEAGISVESELTKQLAEMQRQAKILNPEEFQALVARETGMPYEDFRQQMREYLLTQRLMQQEIGSKIVVSRAEAQKYYEEHKDEFIREDRVFLSQILFSTAGKTEQEIEAIEKKARSIVERARQGERFSDLVKEASEDPEAAQNQGRLPSLRISELRADIAEMVKQHDRGYVSDPIRIPGAIQILRIDEKHRAGLASFEEVENEINARLWEPRFQAAARPYLTNLRLAAFLEIREGYVDTGAAPGKDTRWMDPAQLKPETVTREEVASQVRRKRLLWLVPVPGTRTSDTSTSASR